VRSARPPRGVRRPWRAPREGRSVGLVTPRTSPPAAGERRRPLRAALAASLLVLFSACAPRSPEAAAPAGEASLRVLVYNIHAGKDAEGVDNLARVAEVVRGSGADVVLLQEVDRGTERSGRVDQLARLASLTGLHGSFGKTLDYQGGEYGIAILSRWPVVFDTLLPLPIDPPQERAGGSYEPRGALVARLEGPLRLVALNTHLDASREDHYRIQEVRTVVETAEREAAAGGALVLVGGDFNSEPGTRVVGTVTGEEWSDAWRCGRGEGLTFPARAAVKRIDYLFLGTGLRCVEASVLETEASDHRPLLVVVGVER